MYKTGELSVTITSIAETVLIFKDDSVFLKTVDDLSVNDMFQ